MTIRNIWLHGLTAATLVAPAVTFAQDETPCPLTQSVATLAQPPQSDVEPGADVDQILDRAEERAESLDETTDQPGRRGHTFTGELPQTPAASASPQRREDRGVTELREEEATLPPALERLRLTDEERVAVLRVIGQYDRQIRNVLDRFEDLHAEAIGVEAIPVAEMMRQKGDVKLVDSPDGPQRRTAGFRPGDATTRPEGQAADQPAEKIKELGRQSPLAGPAAETWRKLHELHLEAVQLEAQKLVAIEKLLPAGKLEKLHRFRGEQHGKPTAEEPGDRPERPDLQNENQNPEEERRDRERDRAQGAGGSEAGASGTIDPNRSDEPLPDRRESGED